MIRILQGNARTVLASLPAASVQCVVTSPPYYLLRDYGVAGQIGAEATPTDYIAALVDVFAEVRRVLRDDGTVLLNLGDSYGSGEVGRHDGGRTYLDTYERKSFGERQQRPPGTKPKDLMMIPASVALALQADGWTVRSQMPWIKRSTMPESCTDRPTSAVEYVFMLTKSNDATYWTHRDHAGSRTRPEPDYRWVHRKTSHETHIMPDGWDTLEHMRKLWRRINLWDSHDYFWDATAVARQGAIPAGTRAAKGGNVRGELKDVNGRPPEYWDYTGTRNFRNSDLFFDSLTPPHGLICDAQGLPIAIDVNPGSFDGAHFATFPPALVEPLVQAGTSEHGCCAACGAPWTRRTEQTASWRDTAETAEQAYGPGSGNRRIRATNGGMSASQYRHIGWSQSCACPSSEPVPCTVLDPFAGAFTTALVADRLQRHAIGIELNPAYCDMARARIEKDAGMFAELAS